MSREHLIDSFGRTKQKSRTKEDDFSLHAKSIGPRILSPKPKSSRRLKSSDRQKKKKTGPTSHSSDNSDSDFQSENRDSSDENDRTNSDSKNRDTSKKSNIHSSHERDEKSSDKNDKESLDENDEESSDKGSSDGNDGESSDENDGESSDKNDKESSSKTDYSPLFRELDEEKRKELIDTFREHLFMAVITINRDSIGHQESLDRTKDTGLTSTFTRYKEGVKAVKQAAIDKYSLLSTIFSTIAFVNALLALILVVDTKIELLVFNVLEFITLLAALLIQLFVACKKNDDITRLRKRETDSTRHGHTIFVSEDGNKFLRIVDEIGEHYYISIDGTKVYMEDKQHNSKSNSVKNIILRNKPYSKLSLRKMFMPINTIMTKWRDGLMETYCGSFQLEDDALGAILYYIDGDLEMPFYFKEVRPYEKFKEVKYNDDKANIRIKAYSHEKNGSIDLDYELPEKLEIDSPMEEYKLVLGEIGLQYSNGHDNITYRSIKKAFHDDHSTENRVNEVIYAVPCKQNSGIAATFVLITLVLFALSMASFAFLIAGKETSTAYEKTGHAIGLFTAFITGISGVYFVTSLDNELKTVETRITTRDAHRDHVKSQIHFMRGIFKTALHNYIRDYSPHIGIAIDFQVNLLEQRYEYLSSLV